MNAQALVEELWRDRTGVVSTQMLQEFAVNLRRKSGCPLDAKALRFKRYASNVKYRESG
jgi:hypothetical protein